MPSPSSHPHHGALLCHTALLWDGIQQPSARMRSLLSTRGDIQGASLQEDRTRTPISFCPRRVPNIHRCGDGYQTDWWLHATSGNFVILLVSAPSQKKTNYPSLPGNSRCMLLGLPCEHGISVPQQ